MGGPGREGSDSGEGGTQEAFRAGFPEEVFTGLSFDQELANFLLRAG